MKLTVYVPAGRDHYTGIAAGSGIVGGLVSDALGRPTGILVDYEGNAFGAANIVTWADRIHHAASRHVNHYPTTARTFLPAVALIEVGIYDDGLGTLSVPASEEARVAAWLGLPPPTLQQDLLRNQMFRSEGGRWVG